MANFLPQWMIGRDRDVLAPFTAAHKERRELFKKYWKYYRGNHKAPLKVTPGQPDDNVTLNWSKKIVNQGVSFLFGKDVQFSTDDNVKERTPEEQWLDTVWMDDSARGFSKALFLKQVGQNGGVCGTTFVRLYNAEDEKPRLVALDPAMVDIVTAPDDYQEIVAYHILWESGESWKRHRIERTDRDEWEIIEEILERSNVWRMADEGREPWPYNFAPIFHAQNLILANAHWGISDLEDADLNDAINFTASNINRILGIHAHPRTVGFGFEASSLQTTAVDKFWTVPNETARVENLEMQSDLNSSRQHKADLEEAYHQVTSVPRLDPANVQIGGLSGFALQILYGPLLDKTNDKRGTYGAMLAQINRALLVLNGNDNPPEVKNTWQNPLPTAGQERANLFKTLVDGGVSVYAAARVAGYSEEEAAMMNQVDVPNGIMP